MDKWGQFRLANPDEWRFTPTGEFVGVDGIGNTISACNPVVAGDVEPHVGYLTEMHLRAEGDYSCGNGTLTGTERIRFPDSYDNVQPLSVLQYQVGLPVSRQHNWFLAWTSTLSDGVGEITGTATQHSSTGAVTAERELSGHIVIEDGVTGQCDDAEARVSVSLLLE